MITLITLNQRFCFLINFLNQVHLKYNWRVPAPSLVSYPLPPFISQQPIFSVVKQILGKLLKCHKTMKCEFDVFPPSGLERINQTLLNVKKLIHQKNGSDLSRTHWANCSASLESHNVGSLFLCFQPGGGNKYILMHQTAMSESRCVMTLNYLLLTLNLWLIVSHAQGALEVKEQNSREKKKGNTEQDLEQFVDIFRCLLHCEQLLPLIVLILFSHVKVSTTSFNSIFHV